jgi:hypothetical protein
VWDHPVVKLRWLATLAMLLCAAGCRSVGPGHALSSTIPLGGEPLAVMGEASGKACQAVLLWLIPLASDSSVYEAKRAALLDASARYQREAVALVDVSIDFETVSYFVYERRCTWVRGTAIGAKVSP